MGCQQWDVGVIGFRACDNEQLSWIREDGNMVFLRKRKWPKIGKKNVCVFGSMSSAGRWAESPFLSPSPIEILIQGMSPGGSNGALSSWTLQTHSHTHPSVPPSAGITFRFSAHPDRLGSHDDIPDLRSQSEILRISYVRVYACVKLICAGERNRYRKYAILKKKILFSLWQQL